MCVLVVTNMYPPHSYGGYEQSCRDVVERWRSAGHEVEVLTSTVRLVGLGDRTHPETGIRRQLALYWTDHEILNPPLRQRWAMERRNRRALLKALEDTKPDVVSVWAMGAMSFGLLNVLLTKRTPTVLVICDEWPVYGPVTDAWLRPLARRPRLARVVAAVTRLPTALPAIDAMGPACFVSAHLLDTVRKSSPWRFPHATIVHSGIHLEDFPLKEKEDRAWRWHLLYVGRIDPRKGIETVVNAVSKCPDFTTLDIHGGGDERHLSELKALVHDLGLTDRVRFTTTPRHELASAYSSADVVVFPSLWEEPFGLVPLEAMASGTPVVATAVGGAKEFLEDEVNCLTFAPGDVDGLVRMLLRLSGDAQLRRRLAGGGLETASRFGVDRLAEVLERCHLAAAAGSLDCSDG